MLAALDCRKSSLTLPKPVSFSSKKTHTNPVLRSQILMPTCFLAAVCFWPWLSPLRDVSECMRVCEDGPDEPLRASWRPGFWGLNIQVFLSSLVTSTAFLIVSGLIFIPTQRQSNLTKLSLFSKQRKPRKRTNSQ